MLQLDILGFYGVQCDLITKMYDKYFTVQKYPLLRPPLKELAEYGNTSIGPFCDRSVPGNNNYWF